jgi:DNA-binding MarR family transcriptional regulator
MSAATQPRVRRPPKPGLRMVPDELRALSDLVELVTAAMRSPRQRDRLAAATGLPLTVAQLTALRVVERGGSLSATEVAARLGVDASTISRQLRPLEEHRLVARTADDVDRRVTRLRITAAGRKVLGRLEASMLEAFAGALEGWSGDDRALLASLLARLHDDLLSSGGQA